MTPRRGDLSDAGGREGRRGWAGLCRLRAQGGAPGRAGLEGRAACAPRRDKPGTPRSWGCCVLPAPGFGGSRACTVEPGACAHLAADRGVQLPILFLRRRPQGDGAAAVPIEQNGTVFTWTTRLPARGGPGPRRFWGQKKDTRRAQAQPVREGTCQQEEQGARKGARMLGAPLGPRRPEDRRHSSVPVLTPRGWLCSAVRSCCISVPAVFKPFYNHGTRTETWRGDHRPWEGNCWDLGQPAVTVHKTPLWAGAAVLHAEGSISGRRGRGSFRVCGLPPGACTGHGPAPEGPAHPSECPGHGPLCRAHTWPDVACVTRGRGKTLGYMGTVVKLCQARWPVPIFQTRSPFRICSDGPL